MSGTIRPPHLVLSPKDRLSRLKVVHAFPLWALATGIWDKTSHVLLIRWNGDPDRPLGNPVSTGHPTWFVLPDDLHECVLAQVPDDASLDRNEARRWLGLPA